MPPPSPPLHILLPLLPYPFFLFFLALVSALPSAAATATYALSPHMTISNLSLSLIDHTSDASNATTSSLSLLLDTLSACSWLPVDASTFNGMQTAAGNGADITTRAACTHYLGGVVAGTLRATNVSVGGADIQGVKVLAAEGFSALGNRTFEEWREYYGGAVGVLGFGLFEGVYEVGGGGGVSPTAAGGEVLSGVLRDLWVGKDREGEGRERVWSVALPRGKEEGQFVVGGSVQEGGDVRAEGEGFMMPMAVGVGWDGEALLQRMPYALPGVGFDVGDDSFFVNERLGKGEVYFLDSALPVFYTSQAMAENLSALFSPAGRYDETSMVYMVDCNATAPSSISMVFNDGSGGGNKSIPIYPEDLIMPMPLAPRAGKACMSAFQVSSDHSEMRRLGWPFFRNAIVTADVGHWTVKLTARAWPEGGPSSQSTTQTGATMLSGNSTMNSPSRSKDSNTGAVSSSSTSSDSTSPLPTATALTSAPKSDPLSISFTPTASDTEVTASVSPSHWQPGSASPDVMGNAPESWPVLPSLSGAASSTPTVSMTGPVRRKVDGEAQVMADEESGGSGGKEGTGRARGRWWPFKWKIARSLGLGDRDEGEPATEYVEDYRGKGQSKARRGEKVAEQEL